MSVIKLSSRDLTQRLCNNLSPLDLQTLMTILTIPDTHLGLLMFSLRQINNPPLPVYVFTSIKASILEIRDIPLGASFCTNTVQ